MTIGINNTQPQEDSSENFANIILQLFRGRNKELLRHQLLTYIQIVEETNKAQLLETIKDRITPTDTK